MSKKLKEIISTLPGKNPKQMRTLRNQLNNRIKSYEDELNFGKKVGKISESHALFGLSLKDCQELQIEAKKALKNIKLDEYNDDE
jgi:hypothetical protein